MTTHVATETALHNGTSTFHGGIRELSLHEIGLVDGGLNWGSVYRGAAAGAIGGAIAGAIGGGPIGMGGGAIGGAIGGGLVSIFDQLSV